MSKPIIDPASISNLSAADKVLFSHFSVGSKQTPDYHCVHHAFESHAVSQPNAIAVEHLGESISYAELDRQANGVASVLRHSYNVGPGSRVVLLVERSILMVVGILAVLKAGGAYVPLDGVIVTQSTLEHVIKDSGCSVVLTLERFAERVPNLPVVQLEAVVPKQGKACTKPEDLSTPTDSAYIIYTSGTTGKPKGVEVMHGNVTNLVCLRPGNVGMAPGMRVSQLLNISFDMAAWEILGSMSNGCTLCIRGKSSKEWRAVMKQVDIVIATPSMMGPHDPADYLNIKFVATAGEVCPKELADKWAKTANFYNSCGPTEITIVNTLHLHKSGEKLTIGAPSPNNNVYVLDEDLKPVPIGQTGVMWAGGAGISRGYLNLPEKTAERYKPDPFVNDGSMMFNTGDLGRWNAEGELEHFGRTDDQVKVKGFRVELDGVGAAMESHPEVKVATALLIDGELWGFVTPSNVNVAEVKEAAAKIQPYYAVPSKWHVMEEFPHTANGKIDKRALRQIAADQGSVPSEKSVGSKMDVAPSQATTTIPQTVQTASGTSVTLPQTNNLPSETKSAAEETASAFSAKEPTLEEDSLPYVQLNDSRTENSLITLLPTIFTLLLLVINILLALRTTQKRSQFDENGRLFSWVQDIFRTTASPEYQTSHQTVGSESARSPLFWVAVGVLGPFILKLLWRGTMVTFKTEFNPASRQRIPIRHLYGVRDVSTDNHILVVDRDANSHGAQTRPDQIKPTQQLVPSLLNEDALVSLTQELARKIVLETLSRGIVGV